VASSRIAGNNRKTKGLLARVIVIKLKVIHMISFMKSRIGIQRGDMGTSRVITRIEIKM